VKNYCYIRNLRASKKGLPLKRPWHLQEIYSRTVPIWCGWLQCLYICR